MHANVETFQNHIYSKSKSSLSFISSRRLPKAYGISTSQMVKAIIKAGGNAKLTTYKNVKHNAWDKAYQTKELYQWLFAQHRA